MRVCNLWGSSIGNFLPNAIQHVGWGRCRLAGPIEVALLASEGISSRKRHKVSTHVIVIKLEGPQCRTFNSHTKWIRIVIDLRGSPRVWSIGSSRLVYRTSKGVLAFPDFLSIAGKAADYIRRSFFPCLASWFWRNHGEHLVNVACTRSTGLQVRTQKW